MPRLLRFAVLGPVFAAMACGSESATISVTTGGESDALTRDPAVTSFVINAVDRTGGVTQMVQSPYPTTSTIDLGNPSQSAVVSLQLTGKTAAGETVVFGAVPFAELGAFNGLTVSLFVQRKRELARMPGATGDARTAPLLATTPRGVYYAGGTLNGSADPLKIRAYDLLTLDDLGGTCPAAATKSFALVLLPQANTDGEIAMAWRIDDGSVNVVGLAQCTDYSALVHLPDTGTSWSDFAGGATVMGDDGTAYVVGPSRTNAASGTVFAIKPLANATTLLGVSASTFLIAQRQGAATAWAPTRGVFVYGGATSSTKVGEVVGANGSVTEIESPVADKRQGLAALAFDANKTMLVTGDGTQPELVDLSCGGCAPTPWGVATNVPLTSPSLFALGNGAFLLVGDDASGATRAFRLTDQASPEIQLRIPRSGARAIKIETGSIVILGGGSSTPESYAD